MFTEDDKIELEIKKEAVSKSYDSVSETDEVDDKLTIGRKYRVKNVTVLLEEMRGKDLHCRVIDVDEDAKDADMLIPKKETASWAIGRFFDVGNKNLRLKKIKRNKLIFRLA